MIELYPFTDALNKTYKVTFEAYKGCEKSIVGTLLNYNSGNIDLYNEEKGELYHIPFSGLKWLFPVKDKSTKENQLKKTLYKLNALVEEELDSLGVENIGGKQ